VNSNSGSHYRDPAEHRRDRDALCDQFQRETVLPLGAALIIIVLLSLGLFGVSFGWRFLHWFRTCWRRGQLSSHYACATPRSVRAVIQLFVLGLGRAMLAPMCGRLPVSFAVSEIKPRQFAAVFVLLTLVGCGQAAPGQGQAPSVPYSRDSGADMRSGPDGGGGGGGM
jgi:hypothetical protein